MRVQTTDKHHNNPSNPHDSSPLVNAFKSESCVFVKTKSMIKLLVHFQIKISW